MKRLGKQAAVKIIEGVWRGLAKETAEAFVKTANGSVRTLVKLISRARQVMVINRVEAPDAEVIAAAGELLMR